ncbi:hypothetical protein [Mycobacterium phage Maco6]|uniref:Uncharacterized protein n=1 Tax=Mycobacterium phage Maco2 TaxID=2805749 RepID=A0A899IND0_9CAUD|nr:hypothetical protein [Mycobacterium phage Maco2]QXN76662.1 hypothetical protein [Mycobacterium phage Maco7]UNY41907.1 hypothetical protein [Mycobacterium phage Maco6]
MTGHKQHRERATGKREIGYPDHVHLGHGHPFPLSGDVRGPGVRVEREETGKVKYCYAH